MGNNSKNKHTRTKKPALPDASHLLLPAHPDADAASTPIIDTHTHLLATFSAYKRTYPPTTTTTTTTTAAESYDTVWDFVRGMYRGRHVEAIVDVWCEAPVQRAWKEVADSALSAQDRATLWDGIAYWFVMGVHPHAAEFYDDAVEQSILDAMAHPRCVGWGEIGLDYHHDRSPPRALQQRVFARQLRLAVRLGKPLTIHTREAEDDTERILVQEVPVGHKIHVHCFTDTPAFARRLLAHFPNLYVGLTGVASYATNRNTAALVQQHMAGTPPDGDGPAAPRVLLETDAPFMVPSNVYASLPALKGARLPFCHTGMIPWVAECVAGHAGYQWTPAEVMRHANENARKVYGI